ncbi:hypothetical protein [Paractinoplanes toevensis]|uniref:CHAT domain-containing protein n=1 Tax=Paractinoplanes toevensis TaxID=571911 RepID=A0A919VY61_9ACTN|nr:hypothetical protein [Actinoplanes toevensis]GIM88652.1 hypothetical protein Ato02nite_004450 [Actinoplanes toevensis]
MEDAWQLAVVAGPPGDARDAAIRRLSTPAGSPVIVELSVDLARDYAAIDLLLSSAQRVLIVTEFDPGEVLSRFREWPTTTVVVGPVRLPPPLAEPVQGSPLDEDGLEALDPWEQTWGGTGRRTTPTTFLTRVAGVAVADGAGRAVTGGLPPGVPYLVRVGIGDWRPDSILPRDTPAFPASLLPPDRDGWWLRAVLSRAAETITEGALFLPRTGEGFACTCTPGDPHTCAPDDRSFWLDLAAVAPRRPEPQQVQLALHHGATTVQIFEITLAVGDGPAPVARAIYTLTKEFDDLGRFGGRDVSIQEGSLRDGRHYLLVNGSDGERVGSVLSDAQAGNAARLLRSTLFDRQLAGNRTLYDRQFGKSRDDYLTDLWTMARVGASVHLGLFPDAADRDALRSALAQGDGPGRIQVALAEGSRAVVPWQLVYGLPIADRAYVCPSVDQFGPGSGGTDVPDRCPHADRHDQPNGTLCPYGFWGLAHVLEVPPSSTRMTLAEATGENPPPVVVAARNDTLPGTDWAAQRAALDLIDRACVVTTDTKSLRAALVEGADLLYLYCHGREVTGGGVALDFGPGGVLLPEDLAVWADVSPRIRWARRRPLVVLNGCFTGARLPETLADFAAAFVQSTGAAGVLATEVVMESGLAAHVMSAFVTAWHTDRRGVGSAMRDVRWQLLARGNVMGLAYSPYCDADLRLP